MSMTANRNTTNNSMTDQQKNQDNYNNYYYNNTVPGVSLTPEDGERIKEAYLDNIADRMTGAVANMITNAFNRGLSVNEIVMAIEETGFAPNPSPAYLRRILENWAENGVTVSKIKHLVSANRALPWWK